MLPTWFGGTGYYGAAQNWSPTGIPTDGFIVQSGTVIAGDRTLSGPIELMGTSTTSEPELRLVNSTLSPTASLTDPNGPRYYGELSVGGRVVNEGTIAQGRFAGGLGNLTIDIGQNSTFINDGAIVENTGGFVSIGHGGGTFLNQGTVTASGGAVTVDAKVVGTGTFELVNPAYGGGMIAFEQSVSHGTTVDFSGAQAGNLQLDSPMTFLGSITGFDDYGNVISMPDTPLTSVSFANNELTLTDNDQVVGKLHIIGDFQTSDFALSQTTTGSSLAFNEPSGPPADFHAIQLAAHS